MTVPNGGWDFVLGRQAQHEFGPAVAYLEVPRKSEAEFHEPKIKKRMSYVDTAAGGNPIVTFERYRHIRVGHVLCVTAARVIIGTRLNPAPELIESLPEVDPSRERPVDEALSKNILDPSSPVAELTAKPAQPCRKTCFDHACSHHPPRVWNSGMEALVSG